jgi:large subunit ribosomal protein L21
MLLWVSSYTADPGELFSPGIRYSRASVYQVPVRFDHHFCTVLQGRVHFLEVVVYAIIRSGGKQYRVAEGELVRVERDVLGSADKDKVTFSEVLMIGGDSPQVGAPNVKGASVVATVLRESRGEKIIVFKKKRRKNHTKRKHGHRQDMVELRIDSINT